MHCRHHSEKNAVAICPDCNSGLCSTCSELYSFPICRSCNDARKKEDTKLLGDQMRKIDIELFLYGLTALLVGSFMWGEYSEAYQVGDFYSPVYFFLAIYLSCAVVAGMQFLRERPMRVYYAPLFFWVFLFIAGSMIGGFIFPFRLWNLVQRRQQLSGQCQLLEEEQAPKVQQPAPNPVVKARPKTTNAEAAGMAAVVDEVENADPTKNTFPYQINDN